MRVSVDTVDANLADGFHPQGQSQAVTLTNRGAWPMRARLLSRSIKRALQRGYGPVHENTYVCIGTLSAAVTLLISPLAPTVPSNEIGYPLSWPTHCHLVLLCSNKGCVKLPSVPQEQVKRTR